MLPGSLIRPSILANRSLPSRYIESSVIKLLCDSKPVAMDANTGIWEAEALLAKRKRGKTTRYLIKWKEFPHEGNKWETRKDTSPELVKEFEATYQGNHSEAIVSCTQVILIRINDLWPDSTIHNYLRIRLGKPKSKKPSPALLLRKNSIHGSPLPGLQFPLHAKKKFVLVCAFERENRFSFMEPLVLKRVKNNKGKGDHTVLKAIGSC